MEGPPKNTSEGAPLRSRLDIAEERAGEPEKPPLDPFEELLFSEEGRPEPEQAGGESLEETTVRVEAENKTLLGNLKRAMGEDATPVPAESEAEVPESHDEESELDRFFEDLSTIDEMEGVLGGGAVAAGAVPPTERAEGAPTAPPAETVPVETVAA